MLRISQTPPALASASIRRSLRGPSTVVATAVLLLGAASAQAAAPAAEDQVADEPAAETILTAPTEAFSSSDALEGTAGAPAEDAADKPQSEPESGAEPEPDAEPVSESESEPEPEPVAEPEPEPEPKPSPESEPRPVPRRTPPVAAPRLAAAGAAAVTSDRPGGRRGLAAGATVLTLGVAAGVTAGIVTHLALTPRCEDPSDMMTCEVPDGADIKKRLGLLGAGPVLGIAGAVMGGLGTRATMQSLEADIPVAKLQRRRKAAVAVGSVVVIVGAAAAAAGPALATVGAKRIAARPDVDVDVTSTTAEDAEAMLQADADARLAGLRLARSGLAMAMVAPTFITTGIALIRNRPSGPRSVRVAPNVASNFTGVTVSGRF